MISHSMQGVDDIFAEFGNTAAAYGFVPPDAPTPATAGPTYTLRRSALLDMHDAAMAARAEDEAQERGDPGRGPAPKAKPKPKAAAAASDNTMLYAIGGVALAGAVAAFILLRK